MPRAWACVLDLAQKALIVGRCLGLQRGPEGIAKSVSSRPLAADTLTGVQRLDGVDIPHLTWHSRRAGLTGIEVIDQGGELQLVRLLGHQAIALGRKLSTGTCLLYTSPSPRDS